MDQQQIWGGSRAGDNVAPIKKTTYLNLRKKKKVFFLQQLNAQHSAFQQQLFPECSSTEKVKNNFRKLSGTA